MDDSENSFDLVLMSEINLQNDPDVLLDKLAKFLNISATEAEKRFRVDNDLFIEKGLTYEQLLPKKRELEAIGLEVLMTVSKKGVMKRCPICGQKNDSYINNCSHCDYNFLQSNFQENIQEVDELIIGSSDLSEDGAEKQEYSKRCFFCGEYILSSLKQCPECKNDLS